MRSRKNSAALVIFAATLSFAQVASAQQALAVLIGNWDYNRSGKYEDPRADADSKDLYTPCNDIQRLARTLTAQDVKVLYNHDNVSSNCNMTREEGLNYLQRARAEISRLPIHVPVIVYYAGHGVQLNGFPYAMPVLMNLDGLPAQPRDAAWENAAYEKRAISLKQLFETLQLDEQRPVIVALDACRTNPFRKDSKNESKPSQAQPTATTKVDDIPPLNGAGLSTPVNAVIQYATAAGASASDGIENSPYLEVLVENLDQGGKDLLSIFGDVPVKLYLRTADSNFVQRPDTVHGALAFNYHWPCLKNCPKSPPAPLASSGTSSRKDEVIRSAGVNVDVFWCAGPGEEARRTRAQAFAARVAALADEGRILSGGQKVNQIRVRVLSEATNKRRGYKIKRDIVRYDATESGLAYELVARTSAELILSRGIQETQDYLSAFMCE